MKQSTHAARQHCKMKKVKSEFEKWRKKKKSKSEAIPENLWEAAINLHGEYKVSEISKELSLAGGTLRKRILETKEKKTTQVPTFIELEILKPEQKHTNWSIEMENTNGEKLKINGNGLAIPNCVLICESFLRWKK